MPLTPGTSPAVVSKNISELYNSGKKRPRKQIIAIAMSEKRKSGMKPNMLRPPA